MSMYYTEMMLDITKDPPFIVSFGYTIDETNWYADVILPEGSDLESLQLFRLGPSTHSEAYWERYGFSLRQPGGKPLQSFYGRSRISQPFPSSALCNVYSRLYSSVVRLS